MTDNLRTRIATTMLRIFDEDRTLTVDMGAWIVADAVIRELGPLVRYWDEDFKELHYCRECGGWGPKDD